jgi:methylated-DNA-[protein]-cysteine S-methyltransferase
MTMRMRKAAQWFDRFPSPVGELQCFVTDDAVVALLWDKEEPGRVPVAALAERSERHPLITRVKKQLAEYFSGKRREFDLPLAPQGTEFQQSAWKVLRQIPYGETLSYGEQARRVGGANYARAVGGANGRNPISILIPCHRVIGSKGDLTGFGGGLGIKQQLLELEARFRGET